MIPSRDTHPHLEGRPANEDKLFAVGAVAAAIAVSSAVALPPANKGKPKTTGEGCKPRIAVILKGTLTGAGSPLTVKVRARTTGARRMSAAPTSRSPSTRRTKVRGQGMKQLRELKSGFRVLVQSRVCKADLANGPTPALTATKVIAH